MEMLKAIDIQRPTKLIVIKDGKKVSEIFVSSMQGFIDRSEFKSVETMNDDLNCEVIIRIEV